MQYSQKSMLFLNVGHFLDHYFMLIFATAAALRLTTEWGMSYSELIPYATPGFIAFGVCAIPAGWLADKWSRQGMMLIFFIGIGLSSILTGLVNTPVQISISLTAIGIFAAIYHPVGLAMVVQGRQKMGIPLAINGVFGNMGVACAALLSGFLIDASGWRSAFIVSGIASVFIGVTYLILIRSEPKVKTNTLDDESNPAKEMSAGFPKILVVRIFGVIFFTTAIGGLIFQSTTFALPKVFEERLGTLADTATLIGWYTFVVFSIAAFAQLVVGYLVDKFPVRTVFASVAIMQAVFFLLMMQLSGVAALVIAIGFMLFVFGQIPINDVLVGRMVRSEWRSRAYGIRYVVTFSVMASAVPFIAWVHGTCGFSVLFGVLAVAASFIFIAALMLPTFEEKAHSSV
ncbi:MAG: MFS family permease [Porticoccaceae bacterium]|jgi:MFS family permease